MLVYILIDNELGNEYVLGAFETQAKAIEFARRYDIRVYHIKVLEVKK